MRLSSSNSINPTRRKVAGSVLLAASAGLSAWVAYDASTIVSTFGLGGIFSEAVVALAALALIGYASAGGLAMLYTAARQQT